jgi:phosphatidylserine/phosphatidylglycerophosphate/cardiolipin synthase-like enzyme
MPAPLFRCKLDLMKRTVSTLALLAAVAIVMYQVPLRHEAGVHVSAAPAAGKIESENHYAPAEDLERLDAEQIDRAQHTLDIAMYAFTDRWLAEALLRAAHRGVVIRIYRDREQFQEEQRHAAEHGSLSSTNLLRGVPQVHIRVKASGRRDLMHLKAYLVDGVLLRDGSANWSNAGLKDQDNNAHFTNDPGQIRQFRAQFEAMWARTNNEEVQ